MKKLVLIGVLVVFVLLAGVVWWGYSNLDGLVKDAIERNGSQAAGTAVTVDSVHLRLGLDEAGGVLEGISLKNPEGFPAGDAVRFGRIEVEIEPASISSNPVVIKAVRLLDPQVNFIMNAEKKSNFDIIRANIQKRPSPESPPPAGNQNPTRILIREFVLGEGRIEAVVELLGGEPLSVDLPRTEEKDLGAPNGAPPDQLARQLLNRISQRVIAATMQRGLEKLLNDQLGGEGKVNDLLKSIIKP